LIKFRTALAFALAICLLTYVTPVRAAAALDACIYLSKSLDAISTGPAFLPSYPTVRSGPLNNTAFLYDNAVAIIALVACREPKKAARIGDAMLLALDGDRYWHDGRLRNAYLAGPVGYGTVKLPGYWDSNQNKWIEDAYQVGSDSGNLAWAILALVALDRSTHDQRYLDGAQRIGGWLTQWSSRKGAGGFTGGTFGEEPDPKAETWKSTEHNTDLAAAFSSLADVTGNKKWLHQAQQAKKFVQAMWSRTCRCFYAGTVENGVTYNQYVALDAQLFPLLALPRAAASYATALSTAKNEIGVNGGFAYGAAKGGLWTEGTAQAALYLELSKNEAEASDLIKTLQKMHALDGDYYATDVNSLPTGFSLETDPSQSRQYFHIIHLAATSWVAIAERRFNPFTGKSSLP
jgi:hypothetical protein